MRLKDKLSRLPAMPAARTRPRPEPEADAEPEAELGATFEHEHEHVHEPEGGLPHDPETGEVLDVGAPVEGQSAAATKRLERLRAQLDFMHSAQRVFAERAPPPRHWSEDEAEPPGEDEETGWGILRKVHTAFSADHHHGQAPVAGALDADASELSILSLDPEIAGVDLRRALYVDTETTGLSGGSGTIPFLIGVAWFEQDRFQVEQLLLRAPGAEVPMLQRLAERMRECSCLISYNGKSFDWPLLRTRFIMNRVPAPPVPPHLDLLHCARRVFKRRLGAVRLVHLEEQVLGFERVDDVPGELIPRTYLDFVRGRAPGSALQGIVEHNVHDLVALAAVLGELARRFKKRGEGEDARDSLGFAEVAARAADSERAIELAEAAADADVRGELAPQALYLSGKLALKRGDIDAAEQAWLRALQAADGDSLSEGPLRLGLAKLYEHKRKDPARALEHARLTGAVEGEQASAHRCARLEKRLARASVPLI